MIAQLLEGGTLWIILSFTFVFGWMCRTWFHKCVESEEFHRMLNLLETFLEFDEGQLMYGPLFHDDVRDTVNHIHERLS